jgi:hypothetical protein
MKLSTRPRLVRELRPVVASLVVSISMPSVASGYSQHEVDPTWFNPCPRPGKVSPQPSVASTNLDARPGSLSSENRPRWSGVRKTGASGSKAT